EPRLFAATHVSENPRAGPALALLQIQAAAVRVVSGLGVLDLLASQFLDHWCPLCLCPDVGPGLMSAPAYVWAYVSWAVIYGHGAGVGKQYFARCADSMGITLSTIVRPRLLSSASFCLSPSGRTCSYFLRPCPRTTAFSDDAEEGHAAIA